MITHQSYYFFGLFLGKLKPVHNLRRHVGADHLVTVKSRIRTIAPFASWLADIMKKRGHAHLKRIVLLASIPESAQIMFPDRIYMMLVLSDIHTLEKFW